MLENALNISYQKSKFYKRIFDIVFSLLALIIVSPLVLLIALIIKISSKGPLFYSQLRIGKGGNPFWCYKFRSMYVDADKKLNDLLKNNPLLQKEWKAFRKLKNDPRITFVGKLLRKTSLDEIPQFWNVLKGDLSVVGPRPPFLTEVKTFYGQKASKILSIKPGITGLWQVYGRSNLSFENRIKLDEAYVDQQSFLLDLRLIIKTIPQMILCRGAY